MFLGLVRLPEVQVIHHQVEVLVLDLVPVMFPDLPLVVVAQEAAEVLDPQAEEDVVNILKRKKYNYMKKLCLLFIGVLSMSTIYAQDISDAIRFSQDDIQGTARFRALSGAFGALGGDMSAVSLNPAGAAVFSKSHASFSVSNRDSKNNTQYFNGLNNSNDSNFDITQGGAAFVFASNNSSPWQKFTFGIVYERTNNHDTNWRASGLNTNDEW